MLFKVSCETQVIKYISFCISNEDIITGQVANKISDEIQKRDILDLKHLSSYCYNWQDSRNCAIECFASFNRKYIVFKEILSKKRLEEIKRYKNQAAAINTSSVFDGYFSTPLSTNASTASTASTAYYTYTYTLSNNYFSDGYYNIIGNTIRR